VVKSVNLWQKEKHTFTCNCGCRIPRNDRKQSDVVCSLATDSLIKKKSNFCHEFATPVRGLATDAQIKKKNTI
jgi:hypothetical protein